MTTKKKRETGRQEPERKKVVLRFRASQDLAERMAATAKREGLSVQALMAEAICKHVFDLETRGKRGRKGQKK